MSTKAKFINQCIKYSDLKHLNGALITFKTSRLMNTNTSIGRMSHAPQYTGIIFSIEAQPMARDQIWSADFHVITPHGICRISYTNRSIRLLQLANHVPFSSPQPLRSKYLAQELSTS